VVRALLRRLLLKRVLVRLFEWRSEDEGVGGLWTDFGEAFSEGSAGPPPGVSTGESVGG
jgi:hypothetical protein